MQEPPAGIVGKLAASRPVLAISILSAGLIALGVAGARQLGGEQAGMIASYAGSALLVVAAPLALAAMQPREFLRRILFYAVITLFAAVFLAADLGRITLPFSIAAPPLAHILAALSLMIYISVLTPLGFNVARLSVASSFAAIIGAVGGAGYLAIEALWGLKAGAIAVALALTVGVGIGVSIGADFARFFAGGASQKNAAAGAGHNAIAISAYSLLVVAAYFAVQSFDANFGAVEWRIVWAGITASAAAIIAVLVIVTGSLVLFRLSEQVAVDENYRRLWFAANWRPVRLALPPTTAGAVTAIAGVFVVIALFEAGFAAPLSLAAFFALVWLAAIITFVSLRTSILIVALLAVSAVLSDYVYAIFALETPALAERLAGLAFSALAIGHMMVSWRDAGDNFRNPRDVTEYALNDGLRRFLFVVGGGAAAIFVSLQSFAWHGGLASIAYFLMTSMVALILAPAMMMTVSTQFKRY